MGCARKYTPRPCGARHRGRRREDGVTLLGGKTGEDGGRRGHAAMLGMAGGRPRRGHECLHARLALIGTIYVATSIDLGLPGGTFESEPSAPPKLASVYPRMRVFNDITWRSNVTFRAWRGRHCRFLRQHSADVAHPKAECSRAVQWAHNRLSRIIATCGCRRSEYPGGGVRACRR